MNSNYILILAFAILGASATPYFGSGLNGAYNNYGTTVTNTCHCVKSISRPQFQSSTLTTIPGYQHFYSCRTTPVVERIPFSVTRRIEVPSYTSTTGSGTLSGNFGRILNSGSVSSGVNTRVLTGPQVGIITSTKPGSAGAGYISNGVGVFANTVY